MATALENIPRESSWQPQLEAAAIVQAIREEFWARSPAVQDLGRRLHRETGTRLSDWLDHFALPADPRLQQRLTEAGFTRTDQDRASVWEHPGGLFPKIELHDHTVRRITLRVESVADFLVAQRMDERTPIEDSPLAPMRKARVAAQWGTELWVVERHGCGDWEPPGVSPDQIRAVLWHQEGFGLRRRRFADPAEGFDRALEWFSSAARELGLDWACDLFFAAEREYWTRRNRAARVQKARQDALGLGWANHDHHTYRSSRRQFGRLIETLETMGFVCRERFYAGREAGWGAQVLEQPGCGVVIFADVDLAPEEVTGDFAHEPLPERSSLGTVGLWCKLHGEAFLEAGMHHLECRFDFDAAGEQLRQAGVRTMAPFTDLPYLKQAFTEGEVWPVEPRRIEAALAAGAITAEQAEEFRSRGAIGSHLEILQRDEGYKGFNQAGINEIIRETDPRRAPVANATGLA